MEGQTWKEFGHIVSVTMDNDPAGISRIVLCHFFASQSARTGTLPLVSVHDFGVLGSSGGKKRIPFSVWLGCSTGRTSGREEGNEKSKNDEEAEEDNEGKGDAIEWGVPED